MSNYEKYKRFESIIRKIEYAVWGILVLVLAFMEVGFTINLPLAVCLIAALLMIPAIVLDGIITEIPMSYYFKKDLKEQEEEA